MSTLTESKKRLVKLQNEEPHLNAFLMSDKHQIWSKKENLRGVSFGRRGRVRLQNENPD